MKPKFENKAPHGGKRAGTGRKLGSGQGRTSIGRSVCMTQELWDKLDRITDNRSRYISDVVANAREGKR